MHRRLLLAVFAAVPTGCSERAPDFVRVLRSPSAALEARLEGYQPRGTIDGVLTLTVSPSGKPQQPLSTFGHLLNLRAGWLDEQTLVLVYDELEARNLSTPAYPTGLADSAITVVMCDARYLDCQPLLKRLALRPRVLIKQFPEGDWPNLG